MLRLLVGGKISHSFGRYTYKARIFRYGEFIHCCVKCILELRIETKSDEIDCTGCCWYDYSLVKESAEATTNVKTEPINIPNFLFNDSDVPDAIFYSNAEVSSPSFIYGDSLWQSHKLFKKQLWWELSFNFRFTGDVVLRVVTTYSSSNRPYPED